jgi:hypothetical protein
VVTTFIGAGIMSAERPLPMNRIYLLNPGQSLDVRRPAADWIPPAAVRQPRHVGVLDTSSGVCLSSDCFGAPLPTATLATAEDAADVSPGELRAAQLLWATVDSPWVHTVDPAKFAVSFGTLRDFSPTAVLSTHLPPVTGDSTALFATLLDAPSAYPFTGPDQAALEATLHQFPARLARKAPHGHGLAITSW